MFEIAWSTIAGFLAAIASSLILAWWTGVRLWKAPILLIVTSIIYLAILIVASPGALLSETDGFRAVLVSLALITLFVGVSLMVAWLLSVPLRQGVLVTAASLLSFILVELAISMLDAEA